VAEALPCPGLYRLKLTRTYLGGPEPKRVTDFQYRATGEGFEGLIDSLESQPGNSLLRTRHIVLSLAAVDPAAEAELVGLNEAVSGQQLPERYYPLTGCSPRYDPNTYLQIPVLLRRAPAYRFNERLEAFLLPLPATEQSRRRIENEGVELLNRLEGEPVAATEFSEANIYPLVLRELMSSEQGYKTYLNYKAGPVNYAVGPSDGSKITVEPVGVVHTPYFGTEVLYRWPYMIARLEPAPGQWLKDERGHHDGCPHVKLKVVGLYEVERLDMGRDPLNELPMETYRPADGLLVRTPQGTPLPEPVKLTPIGVDLGLLTLPPLMLTTLDVARVLYGDDCISAIRVRVAGAAELSEASQRRIEWVAKEIVARTGLRVDVTTGSSPTYREVFIAGLECEEENVDIPPLGYVRLPFVKKNVAITIYRELNRGNLAILGAVLLVAMLSVLTQSAVSVYSRLTELATCRALGWRPVHVVRDVVFGALGLGALAAATGVVLSLGLSRWSGFYQPGARLLLIAGIAVGIYGLGSLIPGLQAQRVAPILAMATGEAGEKRALTLQGRGGGRARAGASVAGLALGAVLGRWRRLLLTLFTLAGATALLQAFLLVTVRLKGILCGSLLGDFIIVEIGPRHLLLAILCLGLAAVAVSQILGLNIAERRSELRLLTALGWPSSGVRLMIAGEGGLLGLVGGLAGSALAVGLLSAYYGITVLSLLPPALALLPVPVVTAFLAALVPALAATTTHW